MARYGQPASNLRGIPFLIFDAVMYYHHNPGLLIQDKKEALHNIVSLLYGKYGEGKQKENITGLCTLADLLQDKCQPIDQVGWAVSDKNDFIKIVNKTQREMYRIISELGILDEASMTDYAIRE